MTSYVTKLLETLGIDETNVPFISRIREQDAFLLLHFPLGTFYQPVTCYEKGVLGQCHAVTAYMCLSNPDWIYCFGLAECGDCLTEWSIHSWCLNADKELIEPTTLVRQKYVGIEVPEHLKKSFIWEEIPNILRMGFTITPNMWMYLLTE